MANNYLIGDKFKYEGVTYTIVDRVDDDCSNLFIDAIFENEIYSFFYDEETDEISPSGF